MREMIGSYYVIFLLLLLVATWIWALIDVVRSNFKDSNTKLIWVVLVCVGQFIGPLLWFAMKSNFTVDETQTEVSDTAKS